MDFGDEKIKARLLYHLRKKRIINEKHTHYDTLIFGFPKHLGKEVKNIANKLIKESWLVAKSNSYGLQVSLNKEKILEIDLFIKRVLNFYFDE